MFVACSTQWRIAVGISGAAPTGLDYAAVVAVMQALGVKKTKRVFRQVQLIEAGALSIY